MPTYAIRAEVLVPKHGHFPIDMLRYDRCCPDTEEDSYNIARTNDERGGSATALTINVVRIASENKPWTVGRWSSFGVRIVPKSITKI